MHLQLSVCEHVSPKIVAASSYRSMLFFLLLVPFFDVAASMGMIWLVEGHCLGSGGVVVLLCSEFDFDVLLLLLLWMKY